MSLNFNKKINEELRNQDPSSRNDAELLALKKAEEQLTRVKYDASPASRDFAESLKSKILEARHQKFNMKNLFTPIAFLLKPVFYIPAVVVVLIVAVLMTSLYLWPAISPQESPFTKLSSLMINAAYAQDNFEIEPTNFDSLGVDSATAFIIKSKDVIDPDKLRENITLIPDAAFDFEKISDNEFKVIPENQLESRVVYRLQIASAYVNEAGLVLARNYSWAFQVKDQFKIRQTLPRNQATDVALDTGIEIIFSHENFTNYEKAVTFEPAISGRFEVNKRMLVFIPKELKSGVIYKVTVNKDLLAVKGSEQKLSEDYVFEFETSAAGLHRDNYNNYFHLSNYSFNQYPTDKEPYFEVYRYNFPTDIFSAEVYAFKSSEQYLRILKDQDKIPYWASYNRSAYQIDYNQLSKVATYEDLTIQKSPRGEYLVLPDKLPAGYYIFKLKVGDETQQAYFQVTDLAVFSTITETDSLVWVNDVKTQQPVERATVEFIDKNYKQETDNQGIIKFKTSKVFDLDGDERNNFTYFNNYLMVSRANQSIILPVYLYADSSDSFNPDDYWKYLYTDREKYQPTDTINFWGFIKTRANQTLTGKMVVKMTSFSWDYNYDSIIIDKQEVTANNGGTFSGSLDFKNISPGFYRVEWSLDDHVLSSSDIEIYSYVKPDYNLEVTAKKHAVFAGDTIPVEITAAFFEGTPVADYALDYEWGNNKVQTVTTDEKGQVRLQLTTQFSDCPADFTIEDPTKTEHLYDDFHCNSGNANSKYLDTYSHQSEQGDLSRSDGFTVYGSHINSTINFEQIKGDKNKAQIEITTTQVDLDRINNPSEDPYAEPVPLTPAKNISFKAKVIETDYVRRETGEWYDFINKIVRKTYTYDRIEKEIISFDGQTDDKGKNLRELDVDPAKSYKVLAIFTDETGRHSYDQGYYYRNYYYEDELYYQDYNLIFENKKPGDDKFSVGDTVQVVYENVDRYKTGTDNFLYYKLKMGLLDYQIKGNPRYEFTFSDQFVPNVYIQGVYFDGVSYHETSQGGKGWYWGGLQASLDVKDRNLKLEIKTDKAKYQPGENATIEVFVKDINNQPKRAFVNLNVVDEAFYAISNESVDPLAKLFESVSAGELLTLSSSNLADWERGPGGGGAEKGGGGDDAPRSKFPDVALFKDIETNNSGYAKVTFKLPDSITAWRITAQAVSEKLYAGFSTEKMPVSLPVFVLPTFANEYLASDKPEIKVRAYGDELKTNDAIKFNFSSKTLNLDKVEKNGVAYVPTYFAIPQLISGTQELLVGLEKGAKKDSVLRSVKVLDSRLKENERAFYEVKEGLKVASSDLGRTKLIFSDKNQGQFYDNLLWLSWTNGDRLDQKLSRVIGDELRRQYFGDQIYNSETIDSSTYMLNGGITLLPYSDDDLELTAKVASVAADYFDKTDLIFYFSKVLTIEDSNREEIALALWGLASLNEPVLLDIQNFATLNDLTDMEKLYIALAAQQIGDGELAARLYREVMANSGEKFAPYYRVNVGEDNDDILAATSLAAIIAGGLNDDKHEGLWQYVEDNYTENILINLEKLMYMKKVLPQYIPGAVKFTVVNGSEKIEKTLELGQTFTMSLAKEEVDNLQFENISGAVGLEVVIEKPLDLNTAKTSNLVSIDKEYFVNGKKATTLKENDVVEIRLYPKISSKAPDSSYQVTDFIPSGLTYMESWKRGENSTCHTAYPFEVNGQTVKFGLWYFDKCSLDYLSYYARVVNPGVYTAEPAVIQALKSFDIKNYSDRQTITIVK